MAKILSVEDMAPNPVRRKKRKARKSSRRRSSSKRRRNPRKKKRSAPKRRVRRRRSAPKRRARRRSYARRRNPAPRRRRRRVSSKRRSYRRRRNPVGGALGKKVMEAASVFGGVLALDLIASKVVRPSGGPSYTRVAVKSGVGIVGGWLLCKLFKKGMGNKVGKSLMKAGILSGAVEAAQIASMKVQQSSFWQKIPSSPFMLGESMYLGEAMYMSPAAPALSGAYGSDLPAHFSGAYGADVPSHLHG